jgi:hypothetical protein
MAKKKSETTDGAKTESKKPAPSKAPAKKAETDKPKATAAAASAASSLAPAKAGATKLSAKPQTKGRPNVSVGSSMFDTNLAASSAASMLFARRKNRDKVDDPISVDQIKNDLNKSNSAVAGQVLDQHAESTGGKRPNLPFNQQGGAAGGGNIGGSSQTVGQAAARVSVPRRTAG